MLQNRKGSCICVSYRSNNIRCLHYQIPEMIYQVDSSAFTKYVLVQLEDHAIFLFFSFLFRCFLAVTDLRSSK